jgi:nucleoid-associated protein YgaU
MSQTRITGKMIVLLTAVSFLVLYTAGCDCPKQREALLKQNQALSERVAELESQLSQADAAASTATTETQPPADETAYTVIEGDSLWKIAKEQLGKGTRYKEILALNPQISQNVPLAIGTKLKLPPR